MADDDATGGVMFDCDICSSQKLARSANTTNMLNIALQSGNSSLRNYALQHIQNAAIKQSPSRRAGVAGPELFIESELYLAVDETLATHYFFFPQSMLHLLYINRIVVIFACTSDATGGVAHFHLRDTD